MACTVSVKDFSDLAPLELLGILKLRAEVFVVEQACCFCDPDDKDAVAVHVFATDDDGKVSACARVLPPGAGFDDPAIGRVVSGVRGVGLGRTVFRAALDAARAMYPGRRIRLGGQVQARGFYERFGFRQDSDVYLEDGIPHIEMVLDPDLLRDPVAAPSSRRGARSRGPRRC